MCAESPLHFCFPNGQETRLGADCGRGEEALGRSRDSGENGPLALRVLCDDFQTDESNDLSLGPLGTAVAGHWEANALAGRGPDILTSCGSKAEEDANCLARFFLPSFSFSSLLFFCF